MLLTLVQMMEQLCFFATLFCGWYLVIRFLLGIAVDKMTGKAVANGWLYDHAFYIGVCTLCGYMVFNTIHMQMM